MAYNPSYHNNHFKPTITTTVIGANDYVPNYQSRNVNPHDCMMTMPMDTESMMKMFQEYKESCRIRINSCPDNVSKVSTLESMVTELLEQNKLLLHSLIELSGQQQQQQQQLRSKDSLLTSTSSFNSFASSSPPTIPMTMMMMSPGCPPSDYNHAFNGANNLRSSSKDGAKDKKKMQAKDVLIQTSNDDFQFNELKINYESIKSINEQLVNDKKQLEEELNELRYENDNLRHDMSNLVQILNQNDGNAESSSNVSKVSKQGLMTFCDSITPEDVYGPIESLKDLELSSSESFGDAKHFAGDAKLASQPKSSKFGEKDEKEEQKKRQSVSLTSSPTKSSKLLTSNSQLMMLMEEKDSLISRLQLHLEEVTKQLNIRDEVIKRIEDKLLIKRRECSEWINKATELECKLNESTSRFIDLKSRELILIEDKRSLIAKLNQESDELIEMRENFEILKKQLQEVIKSNNYQSQTISHLKEALVSSKMSASSTSFASSSANNSTSNIFPNISNITTFSTTAPPVCYNSNCPFVSNVSNGAGQSIVTSASNTAFGLINFDNPKTVINKSTPHLPSNGSTSTNSSSSCGASGSRTSFKLDHV